MKKAELLALVADEESRALGQQYGELSSEREKALDYYFGRPFGNEVEGRSQIVSTDVRDSIEGILPLLLDIFTSSKSAVEFEPQGVEDEKQAKQATDLCNYVFYRQNNGFLVLYQWFKDALLQKNGIVKFWYEDYDKTRKEKYENLSELELAQMLQDPNIDISATSEREDGTLEIEITVHDKGGKVCIANVPPEEFLVSPRHNSISMQAAPFAAHRCKKTISSLNEMGYDTKDLRGDDESVESSPEYLARRQYDEETLEVDSSDPAMRHVWVSEIYMRVDWDGDGVAELRKILKCGDTILENEEVEIIPFAAITPIIMCHRFFGLSLADQTMDIQYHKSVLWRQMMDNLYLTNNPRFGVLENQVELDDLLTGRVGGIVRHKVPNAVTPIETRFVAGQSFPMLEYLDGVKENRSGVTRYNQGSDADSLNKTATGVSRIMDAAMMRTKLIARVFAETGVVDLFKGILHCLSKYSTQPMQMRLSNGFEAIDPRQWRTMWDMTVNVGLGTGDKTQQLMQLQTVATQQFTLRQAGAAWVTDKNLYNMARKTAELAGYPHDGLFFTDPETVPPAPPPPNPDEGKMQIEAQKMAQQGQIAAFEMQAKEKELMVSTEIEKYKADLQAQTQLAMESMRQEAAKQLEVMRIDSTAQMKIFEQNNARAEADGIKQELGGGLQALGQQLVKVSDNLLKMEQMQTAQTQTIEQIISVITGDREIVSDDMGEPVGIRIIPSSMKQLPQGPITQNVARGMA